MLRMKMFAGLAVVATILAVMSSTALAAPGFDTSTETPVASETVTVTPAPVTGTIQNIEIKTDGTTTTVVVTILGKDGITYTVTYSLDEAISMGLVVMNGTTPEVVTAKIGTEITFTPTPTPSPTPTVAPNPVEALIAAFFGLQPSVVEGFHTGGSGYGVIAQACWMSFQLKGDASECEAILAAKQSGNYSGLGLPEGVTVSNWGQFKKLVQQKGQNLGSIVSGHAASIFTATPTLVPTVVGSETPVPSLTPEGSPTPSAESIFGPGYNGNGGNGNGNGGNGGNGNGYGRGNNHGNGGGTHIHYPGWNK